MYFWSFVFLPLVYWSYTFFELCMCWWFQRQCWWCYSPLIFQFVQFFLLFWFVTNCQRPYSLSPQWLHVDYWFSIRIWQHQCGIPGFMYVMKQTIPSSETKTRCNLPWLSKSLIQSIQRRNMLFKQYWRVLKIWSCSQQDNGETTFSQETVHAATEPKWY